MTRLYAEADELSLHLRREKLSLQYATRLAANPSNPAFTLTFSPQFLDIYECKPNTIRPFGLRILPLLEFSKINPKKSKNISSLIFRHGIQENLIFYLTYIQGVVGWCDGPG